MKRSTLIAVLVIVLVLAGYMLGLGGLITVLKEPHTWVLIVPPAAVIAADGIISLYFFRGDPGCQAARLQAASDDAIDILGLALFPTPMLLAAAYALLLFAKHDGHTIAAWVPEFSVEVLRSAALLYAAAYFVCKAASVAYVHTARFNRSGRRLLGGGWLQLIRMRGEADRIRAMHEEEQRAIERRAALGLNDFRH